ncbi:MAG: FAD-dependent oxidoreductase [Solirubrobacterales bacterium]
MRVLIVGGGVAGLALAAKLGRHGREPVVVEKAPEYGQHGYSLALYPFGSAVLHGIGAYDDFVSAGREMKTYELADHAAEVIQSVDFGELLAEFGPSYCTTHASLVEILRRACGEGVDLRIGTREEIFPPKLVREYWLRGAFFGAYLVPGKSTFVAAVPVATAGPDDSLGEAEVLGRLRKALGNAAERVPEIAAVLEEAHDLWPWPLADLRSHELRKGPRRPLRRRRHRLPADRRRRRLQCPCAPPRRSPMSSPAPTRASSPWRSTTTSSGPRRSSAATRPTPVISRRRCSSKTASPPGAATSCCATCR